MNIQKQFNRELIGGSTIREERSGNKELTVDSKLGGRKEKVRKVKKEDEKRRGRGGTMSRCS